MMKEIGVNNINIFRGLSFVHKDFFDKLIISIAMSLDYALISKDEELKKGNIGFDSAQSDNNNCFYYLLSPSWEEGGGLRICLRSA